MHSEQQIHLSNLNYLIIDSTDPEKWRSYGTDILGMMDVKPPAGAEDAVYLKADERAWRLAVHQAPQDGYRLSGWELKSGQELDAVGELLKQHNIAFQKGTPEEAAERQVKEFIRLQDPAGNTLELCNGCGLDYAPFISPLGVPEFVTGDDGNLGLGHVVLCAENLLETRNFYQTLFNFRDSDYMDVGNPDGSSNGLYFMHCNPRHHSLALYEMPAGIFPGNCVHIMLEVPDIDTVGLCLERVNEAGIHIFSTLGRHTNDRMLSFYMMTPGGFSLEYGCQGRLLDLNTFQATRTTGRGSLWGHAFQLPEMPGS